LAAGYFVNFTTPVVQNFFATAFKLKPSLENDLKNAKSTVDFERVFKEAVGVIDAKVGTGSISVDNGLLTAVKGIRFEHDNGVVSINGSTLNAMILHTGGSGTGKTTITNSKMKSQGTEIQVGQGANIIITGNASIKQS